MFIYESVRTLAQNGITGNNNCVCFFGGKFCFIFINSKMVGFCGTEVSQYGYILFLGLSFELITSHLRYTWLGDLCVPFLFQLVIMSANV